MEKEEKHKLVKENKKTKKRSQKRKQKLSLRDMEEQQKEQF